MIYQPDHFHPKGDKPVCLDCKYCLKIYHVATPIIERLECLHKNSLIDYDLYTGRANYRTCQQMRETMSDYFCGYEAKLFIHKTPIDTTVYTVEKKPSLVSRLIKWIGE